MTHIFQYLKGAIRSSERGGETQLSIDFQYLKGAIRRSTPFFGV